MTPLTCFTIHSTDRQKCSIFNHILWLCAKIRGKWEETPWNREQWDVKMSLDLDTAAASLLLPLLWTMKIKTFGAMVVEKPHFWLTNYQILIVLQFPHICKHTRKQTYCMRVVFPFSNSPLTLVWEEGAVSPILNCMGVYDKIFPITKYERGWSKMWCLKVKAQICHVCHDYSNYTFMVLALENRENKFFAQHFWQKCVSS